MTSGQIRVLPSARKSSGLTILLSISILAIIALGSLVWLGGETDFLSFYTGARLAGTAYLYSVDAANEIQRDFAPASQVRAYIRPPFYAALLWPLGKLPYYHALLIWQVANLAAFCLFIWIWSPDAASVMLCCWYFPLWMSFMLAQDAPLILLSLATSTTLLTKNRHFLAGLVFSLCAIKFHLFLLIPVLIIVKKFWKFSLGLGTGGAVLLIISFIVAGPQWPVAYYEMLSANEAYQGAQIYTANLAGLFRDLPYLHLWIAVATAVLIAAVISAVRRESIDFSMALIAFGGVLISLHSFLYDLVLLLPLVLTIHYRFTLNIALVISLVGSFAGLMLTESVSNSFPLGAKLGQAMLIVVLLYAIGTFQRMNKRGSSDAAPTAHL